MFIQRQFSAALDTYGREVLSLAGAVLARRHSRKLAAGRRAGLVVADSVAALLIAGMLLLEGTRTVASARQLVR
jgi:hypothetical protein